MAPLRVLAVTNMYPTKDDRTFGIFVEQQIESLRALGILVSVLFLNRRKEGRRAYWRIDPMLREWIHRLDPDVVHVMYGGVLAERVTRHVTSRPVIVTYHGSDLQGVGRQGPIVSLTSRYGVWASIRAARRASGVVAVAEHLVKRLPPEIDRRRVRVIPCGVDLERFAPLDRQACQRRLNWSSERVHVIFATNNDDPIKRPELAAAAVEVLRARGVPADLHVLRGVPYPDVPVWLNASDAVLVTSRSEGSPTIVKEALACNRPVVSVAVGDVSDQIAGIAGCFVCGDGASELADKLQRVSEGPRVVSGREHMVRYSIESTAKRLCEFYEETLESWRGSAAVPAPEPLTRLRRTS